MNSFRCAGIWPVNPDVRESKVSPAALYHDEDNTTDESAKNEESAKTPSTNPSTTTVDKPSKLTMEPSLVPQERNLRKDMMKDI